jgi:hypothetical protein
LILVETPIEKVWQALTDFKSYPTWNPIVGKLKEEMKEGNKIATFMYHYIKLIFLFYFPIKPTKH